MFSILFIGSNPFSSVSVAQVQDFSEKTIELQVGNKSYPLYYHMSNGGTINSISTDTYLTMAINVTSPTDGKLDMRFSRELYDALSFTEHDEPIIFADGVPRDDLLAVTRSCEETSLVIPLKAGMEVIDLVYADILMNHTHTYPEKIDLFKTIEEEGQKFNVRLITDAKRCDISFVREEKNIHVDIKGRDEAAIIDEGYFRLTVPHGLLGGNYTVIVDGEPTSFVEEQFFTKNYTDIGVESAIQDDFTPIEASHILFSYPKDASTIDIIGTASVSESVNIFDYASNPSLHDLAGEKIDSVEVGQQSLIGISIHNNNSTEQPFVIVVEIRDDNDITTDLFWQTGTIGANSNYTMVTSWSPRQKGENYQIRSFVFRELIDTPIMSAVTSLDGITVLESPLYQFCCWRVAYNNTIVIMNTSHSFEYSLDSGHIKNVQADFDSVTILVTFEDVNRDSHLTMILPAALIHELFPDDYQKVDLEHLAKEIVLFVDEMPPKDYGIEGDSENNLVTIELPLAADSETLEILGQMLI